jgi:hypothetical protein
MHRWCVAGPIIHGAFLEPAVARWPGWSCFGGHRASAVMFVFECESVDLLWGFDADIYATRRLRNDMDEGLLTAEYVLDEIRKPLIL